MTTPEIPFQPFPKMARLSRDIVVTEKIDGTNAGIYIDDLGGIFAASRSRWITPENDNYGWAAWVERISRGVIQTMKHFLLRTVAYLGLYSEIFSALCRWFSRPDCWGRRKPWRTVVTKSLVAAGYLPPTREERNAARAQEQINSEHEALTWIAKQPETIQTCLKSFDPSLLKKFYISKKPAEIYPVGEL